MDNTPAPGTTPHANVLTFFSRPPSPLPPSSPMLPFSPLLPPSPLPPLSYALSPSPDRSSPCPNLGSIGANPGSPDPVFEQSGDLDNDMQFQFEEPVAVDAQDLLRTPEAALPPRSPPAVGPLVRLRSEWHPPMLFEPNCRRKLDADFA